jgi:hypothetical protein
VTNTDVNPPAQVGLRVSYSDDLYQTGVVASYLWGVTRAWRASLLLASYFREGAPAPDQDVAREALATMIRVLEVYDRQVEEGYQGSIGDFIADSARGQGAEWFTQTLSREKTAVDLTVQRLHIGSPWAMTLVASGGVTAATLFALHLLARVLQNPREAGAWLPRVIAGWHQGLHEVEEPRTERALVSAVSAGQIQLFISIEALSGLVKSSVYGSLVSA